VFAIVTALYAGRAYRAQSSELEEQRKINELQAEDLRESLKERKRLREVAERQQADKIGFRLTAIPMPDLPEEGYDFAVDSGEPVHMAVISNESRRPIINVACRIGSAPDTADDSFPRTRTESEFPVLFGRLPVSNVFAGRDPAAVIDPSPPYPGLRIYPGEEYGFLFEINSHRVLDFVLVAVRFTDDAGLHWEIDRDQHLRQLPDRDWLRSNPA
jgi:hypothetical protein